MRAFASFVGILVALSFLVPDIAEGRRRKRKRRRAKKALKATKQTKIGINKLMGKYKFGMSADKVVKSLQERVRKEMEPVIKGEKDPLKQDRLRRELFKKLKKIKKNYVKFTGKRSPWDVSLIDKEFAHKNNETLAVSWEKKERRFFFFHNGRLWKMFVAFNADLFAGRTFEDFALAMETRFGKAERKFSVTLSGESKMDHLAWPKSGNTLLLAYDYTGFYGNFCLSLIDANEFGNVKTGRKLNSPKRNYSDPLVEAVTKGGSGKDANEDIVDQITGKGIRAPSIGGSSSGSSGTSGSSGGSTDDYTPPKRKKRKVNPKNPLDGLDI
jgi:hypothetical protein